MKGVRIYSESLFMSTLNEKLLNKILTLPADLRSQLIEKLILSLNIPIQKEIDDIWAEEVEKRVNSIQSGDVSLVDGEEVITKMRERLKQ